MLIKVTPESAIKISWLSVVLTCCWPLSSTAVKRDIICFKIVRIGSVISAISLFVPLLYGIYLHYDDPIIFVKGICLGTAVLQVIVQTLYSINQHDRLQYLIEEMKIFCKQAKPEERRVLQKYVYNYGIFYGGCIIWIYISALVVVLGTFWTSQPFPTDAEYPFPVDYPPLNFIIFFHQSFIGMQCAAHVCINGYAALLLWFSAARFEILMQELREVADASRLMACMRKYQKTKGYAKAASHVVRFIALLAIAISATGLIFSAITLTSKQSFAVKVQFSFLTAIGLLESFMCAWPADHLMTMSVDAVRGVYESTWYKQNLHFQKHLLIVLLPQKPVTVSINCVMPILSLKYYSSYLSNAFSAFTALRIVLL